MSEFTIRSESVDVEQIMKQIRQRILEKRGADYTEEQIRELASVRLEKFLDPNNLRSDLLEQFRKSRPGRRHRAAGDHAAVHVASRRVFATHRGALRFMRKLFSPLLKLLFNPNTLHQVLHTQAQFNVDLLKREARRKIEFDRSRAEWNALYYEVLHNLVLETTRMGIEVAEPAHEARIALEPPRFQRAPRPRARRRGAVPARGRARRRTPRRRTRHEPAPQVRRPGSVEGFVPAGGAAGPGRGPGRRQRRRRGAGARGAGSGCLGCRRCLWRRGSRKVHRAHRVRGHRTPKRMKRRRRRRRRRRVRERRRDERRRRESSGRPETEGPRTCSDT